MPLRSQIEEVKDSRALMFFGAVLAASHALTAWFWYQNGYLLWFSNDVDPICWPLLPYCDGWPRTKLLQLRDLMVAWGILSILCSALFLNRRTVSTGYIGLAVLTGAKFAFMAQDLRSSHNAHIILFFLSVIFLAVPRKTLALKWGLVSVYFCAGLLKIDTFWLSGAGLGRVPEFLDAFPKPLLASYVLLLELVCVWGLLATNRYLFWLSYLQFIVFQTVSYAFIGYYFPTIMIALLAYLPIERIYAKDNVGLSLKHAPAIIVVCIFISLHALPRLLSNNHELTGEGKFFALHMFDRKTRCEAYLTATAGEEETKVSFFPDLREVPPRLACNPISYFWRVKAACRQQNSAGIPTQTFDLWLGIRFEDETELRTLIDLRDVCSSINSANPLRYQPLKHNDWILLN